jgi:hypothetical protein
MAKFEKGNKLSKGRPKGALNRSTEMMKLSIARSTNRVLDNLPTIMDKLMQEDPKSAVDLAIKLLEFHLPKMSRVEMKAEIEQRIQQISVNIQDGIANKHIKDL